MVQAYYCKGKQSSPFMYFLVLGCISCKLLPPALNDKFVHWNSCADRKTVLRGKRCHEGIRRSFDHPLAHLGPLSPSLSRRLPAEARIARVAASVPTIPSFVASHQNSPDQRAENQVFFIRCNFLFDTTYDINRQQYPIGSKKFNQNFVTHIYPNVFSTKKQNSLLYCHYHPATPPPKWWQTPTWSSGKPSRKKSHVSMDISVPPLAPPPQVLRTLWGVFFLKARTSDSRQKNKSP